MGLSNLPTDKDNYDTIYHNILCPIHASKAIENRTKHAIMVLAVINQQNNPKRLSDIFRK
jgi:hypothetical protein